MEKDKKEGKTVNLGILASVMLKDGCGLKRKAVGAFLNPTALDDVKPFFHFFLFLACWS